MQTYAYICDDLVMPAITLQNIGASKTNSANIVRTVTRSTLAFNGKAIATSMHLKSSYSCLIIHVTDEGHIAFVTHFPLLNSKAVHLSIYQAHVYAFGMAYRSIETNYEVSAWQREFENFF